MNKSRYSAFPGDDYVAGMERSANARYAWISLLVIGMVFSFLVDIVNLSALFSQIFDIDLNNIKYIFDPIIVWGMSVSVSAIYIVAGSAAGNTARLYFAKRQKKYFYFTSVILVVIIIFLIVVAVFRFNYLVEHKQTNSDFNNIFETLLFTSAMFIGAVTSFIFGYFRKNALAEKLAVEAKKHAEYDKQLYEFSKKDYINEHSDTSAYEKRLKELKDSIKLHFNRQNEAKLKLLMVKNDPAEAKDVIDISYKVDSTLNNSPK